MTKDRHTSSLAQLVEKATRPDKFEVKTYEEGTEAWQEIVVQGSNAKERKQAAQEIKRLGTKDIAAAVGDIIKILENSRHDLEHAAAVEALGWIGDPRAVPHLINRLSGSGEKTGKACKKAIIRIGKPAVIPLLKHITEMLSHGLIFSDTVHAIVILGRIRDRRALEPLNTIYESCIQAKGKEELKDLEYATGWALKRIDPKPRSMSERLKGHRPWASKDFSTDPDYWG